MLTTSQARVFRTAVLLALVAWLAIGSVGGIAQGKLNQVQTNDQSTFLPVSAESTRAGRAAKAFTDVETLPGLVVLEAKGALSPEQLAAAQSFASAIPALAVPGADPAAGDPRTVGELLVAPPVVVPSQDGRALLVTLSLDGPGADRTLADGERASGSVVVAVRAAAATELRGTGLSSWVTGPAGFVADLVNAFGGIDSVLLLVALGAVLLILVVVYRSPLLPFVVILTAVFGLSLAGLVVYLLAKDGVLVLNGQSQGILSILVVGASVDYSLLVVARYREELAREDDAREAMLRALRASFAPVTASAATVIAGLLCLLLSDLASNRSLGPVAGIAIAGAYLAAMTFLPAVLMIAGRRSRFFFWPRVPHPTAHGKGEAEQVAAPASVRRDVWTRVSELVARRARPIWVVTVLVLVAFAAFLPSFRASGTAQSEVFLTKVEAVDGEKVLAEHFPAGAVQPAIVVAPVGDAAAVVQAAEGVAGVASATVYTGAPAGQPGAATQAPPKVVDGLVRIDVQTKQGADTPQAVATIRDVRAALAAVAPEALVGGASAQSLDTQDASEHDLRVIVPVVLLVVVVILMLLLRSVLAAVLLLVANVLSFAATLGLSALLFNHVFDFPGADPSVPLYAFCFLVALGVDYSIFLMTRVREESVLLGTRAGVVKGLSVTGSVITSAGLVLAATFAALGIIPLLFLAQLAFIVAIGVLVDTVVVRSLLVPALVHDVGRVSWWPGALARGKR